MKKASCCGEVDQEIGARIKRVRTLRGLTQQDVADHLEVTFQQVQKYERGANRVSCARMMEIAEILQTPVTAFLPLPGEDETSPMYLPDDEMHILKQYRRLGAQSKRTFTDVVNALV